MSEWCKCLSLLWNWTKFDDRNLGAKWFKLVFVTLRKLRKSIILTTKLFDLLWPKISMQDFTKGSKNCIEKKKIHNWRITKPNILLWFTTTNVVYNNQNSVSLNFLHICPLFSVLFCCIKKNFRERTLQGYLEKNNTT